MKLNTRDMILTSLFTALTAIGAFIKIPIPPVPVTLQLFFCCFAGFLLGSKLGMLSQLLYVIIGLCGIPIFTAGGGPSYIFNPTFGYLIGFIIAAYVIGKISESKDNITIKDSIIAVNSGIAVIYAIGVPYLYIIMNFYLGKNFTFKQAILTGFLPFIVKDLILGFIVSLTAVKVVPVLRKLVLS